MPESLEQYKERLARYTSGQDPLKLQAAMLSRLEELIDGAGSKTLARPSAPGKWSISEIIAHLADDELVGAYRIRMILSAPATPIQAFDQDKWAQTYQGRDARESLDLFRALRRANLALLASLTPAQWELYGVHEERGVETIRDIARHYAGHDLNHLDQIKAMLSSYGEGGGRFSS